VAFEARLPPLQPKVSAKLTLLAAGNGSLFAGPSTGGGLLQWGRPEGNMRRPLDVEGQNAQQVRGRAALLGLHVRKSAAAAADGLGAGPRPAPKAIAIISHGAVCWGMCVRRAS
jgi:hypothetical protein